MAVIQLVWTSTTRTARAPYLKTRRGTAGNHQVGKHDRQDQEETVDNQDFRTDQGIFGILEEFTRGMAATRNSLIMS